MVKPFSEKVRLKKIAHLSNQFFIAITAGDLRGYKQKITFRDDINNRYMCNDHCFEAYIHRNGL